MNVLYVYAIEGPKPHIQERKNAKSLPRRHRGPRAHNGPTTTIQPLPLPFPLHQQGIAPNTLLPPLLRPRPRRRHQLPRGHLPRRLRQCNQHLLGAAAPAVGGGAGGLRWVVGLAVAAAAAAGGGEVGGGQLEQGRGFLCVFVSFGCWCGWD